MRGAIEKLDYVGFTYNNIHSSQLGLKSVSTGNRYQRSLLPVAQDFTSDISGEDGTYYFGTKFKNGDISLSIAFDDVSEEEMREISRWLYNDGEIGSLTLDELPHIEYRAKVTSQPKMKYLAFEDSYGARVYKGDMGLSFTMYDPYGYCTNKWLSDYDEDNAGEWARASGLLFSKKVNNVDYYDTYQDGIIPLYNPGDVKTHFTMALIVDKSAQEEITVSLNAKNHFTIRTSKLNQNDIVEIDTRKRLIKVNNIVRNDLLVNGNLFAIPVGKDMQLSVLGVSSATISYAYRYL